MSGTTGQGSPSLSDSTILQLQNEIERIKAENGKLKVRIQKLEIGLQVRERQLASLKFARQMKQERDALKAEVERLNALVEAEQRGSFSSVVRQVRNELDTAIGERDAIRAENDRLLSVVDAKIQDLARANEVGVALVRERDQAREALREVLACRIIPTCEGMHHEPNDQHGYETSCPVVERYQIAMIKAQKALQGGEGNGE